MSQAAVCRVRDVSQSACRPVCSFVCSAQCGTHLLQKVGGCGLNRERIPEVVRVCMRVCVCVSCCAVLVLLLLVLVGGWGQQQQQLYHCISSMFVCAWASTFRRAMRRVRVGACLLMNAMPCSIIIQKRNQLGDKTASERRSQPTSGRCCSERDGM